MKYNRGFGVIAVIGIIIVLIIAGGFAYYYWDTHINLVGIDKIEKNINSEFGTQQKIESVLKEYINREVGFSFKYPKEFGAARESENGNMILFPDTTDPIFRTVFGVDYSTFKGKKQEQDSIISLSKDINSNYTGDFSPYINSEGWNNEKKLIETNKEGDISCLTDKDGVYRAVYCQIKKIGTNIFLIKYTRDSYKGESTIKQYITYNKDIRYEIGGGKGLTYISYFPDNISYDWEGKDKYIIGTVDNLKNHILSKEEVLVEEMMKTLVFN